MSDFLLIADPLTGDPVESYGPPAEPIVRTPMIGRDKRILREVAQAHHVTVEDIVGPRRHRVYVAARREAMQRIRSELGFSFPHIGRLFNRDHTAALYACRGGRPTNPPSEKGAAVTDIVETKLAQDLDAAVGAYQRKFGRQTLIERLKHMLARAEEAQRVTDESFERIGAVVRKAAE